ncbi:MAG: 2Fe-2S iron-sulfur cluster-binding protein [Planctomycetota bacterium]
MLESLLPLIGIALCAFALLQMGLWTTQSLRQMSNSRQQFELSRKAMREQIEQFASEIKAKHDPATQAATWNGYRPFRVQKLERETGLCTSVYLRPEDDKPIPGFKAGQHLTLKFDVPGFSTPVVRCYSLSDAPENGYYRISVKKVLPPRDKPELPSGCVSTFINESLMAGDRILAKAPSGSFYLDESVNVPVVLLAGGIGITPMLSMLNRIVCSGSDRPAILIYGSRHGADHAFKDFLNGLAAKHENIHVFNVYSSPQESDVKGRDFDMEGFVSAELLQNLLPHNKFQFYMCGPPPFMDSIYNGLADWGVPEGRINFEAFGPASVGRKKKTSTEEQKNVPASSVKFSISGSSVTWDGQHENLLDFAEANGVQIESGCRAGSCGTCQTGIVSGKVCYPDGEPGDSEPGKCLVCIARPEGELELEA